MKHVHDVPECSLPVIPEGMYPDESYGEQCQDCKYQVVGELCLLDVEVSEDEKAEFLARNEAKGGSRK